MKPETKTGTAKTAYKKTLDTAISYEYSWTNYETIDEVRAANDLLTDEEVIKVRNDERQTAARQKAMKVAFDAAGIVAPTIDSDEQLRLREMFKVLMSSKKYSEAQAKELASTTLGIDWAE